MKEIKDYLHLYLGCDVLHPDGTTAKLISVGSYECGFLHETNQFGSASVDNFGKLILRKVESLTDEEIRDLIQYDKCIKEYKSFQYQFLPEQHVIIISYTVEDEFGTHSNNWSLNLIRMNAHDFAWCIRKGIDLFGLINNGLAIDKASLL